MQVSRPWRGEGGGECYLEQRGFGSWADDGLWWCGSRTVVPSIGGKKNSNLPFSSVFLHSLLSFWMNFLFCTPQSPLVFVFVSNFLFFIPLYSPLFSPVFALMFLSSFSFTFYPPFSFLFFLHSSLFFFKIFLTSKIHCLLFPIRFHFSFFFPFFSSFFSSLLPSIYKQKKKGVTISCLVMPQDRVVWDVFCKAWLPSPFFSVIAGRVEGGTTS